MNLDNKIGNFDPGKEADFIVLDLHSTELMALRNNDLMPTSIEALADKVFTAIALGSDRAIRATYIMGELAHNRPN